MKKNFPNWVFSTQHVQRPRGKILLSEVASRRWSRWRWGGGCKFSDPSAVYLHERSQEMKELFGSVGGGVELVLAGDQVPRGRALSQWSLLIYLLVNKLTLNAFVLSVSCACENSRVYCFKSFPTSLRASCCPLWPIRAHYNSRCQEAVLQSVT